MSMDITIHASFLPHDDPDAALAFYGDALGFQVRGDVGYGGMRWITVGPTEQPGTSVVLHPPAADPGITDEERRTIAEMMAKGTYAGILLATTDLDGTRYGAAADGAPYLVPLSFHWEDGALLVATPTDSPTGRNLAATRAVRLGLGHTRDVSMIEGEVEVLEIDALPQQRGGRGMLRPLRDPAEPDEYEFRRTALDGPPP